MNKYFVVLVVNGDRRYEEPVDVCFDEQSANERYECLINTYDYTHKAAVVEAARHEPSHYYGRTIRYAECHGEASWFDNQYAA